MFIRLLNRFKSNYKPGLIFLILSEFLLSLIYLVSYGYIRHNEVFARFYSVKGIDVSNHQGDIDWEQVYQSGEFSFVYLKATEGHDFYDDYFEDNWIKAKSKGFIVGAYHFFSLRSSGEEQANNFINHVPQDSSALPAVIDVEVAIVEDKAVVREELKVMSQVLENEYGKKPIL